MIEDLEKFKKLWKFHRGNTLELLKTLSDEELNFTVGSNMGTLGQQFRHLARVDDQYITAIETKKVENNRKKLEFPIEKSVSKLLEQLMIDDEKLLKILGGIGNENLKDVRIDWAYWQEDSFSLVEHLEAMLEHEILHHGELVIYFRSMNKKFPDSWKAWGV